jgi:hypothetical protein
MSAMLSRNRARERSRVRGAVFDVGPGLDAFQIFVGIERCHAAGARRGHRLTIDVIGDIARGEHARDAGRGRVALARPPLTTM